MGRDDTLRELHEILERENQVSVCAVAGMGGIGKTELAVQYALRNQNDYPGGVCWINCRANIAGEILRYYQVNLGLTIPDELEFEAKVSYCWSHWIEGKALLVFDDVQDEQNNDNDFEKYYPKAQTKFKVLVTSRHRLGTNFSRINLEVLAEDTAIKLLKLIVGEARIESQLTEAKALCQWLGYLPLGLELVARYLESDINLNIKTVQKRLERKRLQAQELIHTQQGDMTARLGVVAAFELSWDKLSEDAKNLGCRLSLFAPVAFNWKWVEGCVFGWDAMEVFKMASLMIERQDEAEAEVTRFLEALQQQGMEFESLEDVIEVFEDMQEGLSRLRNQELVRNSLLEAYVDNQYRFHPLLREFFFSKLSQLELVDDYKRSFAGVMVKVAEIIPQNPTKDLLKSVSLAIPHLQE